MALSQRFHEAFKGTVERITGPRTVSAFKEKGVLSVNEFVLAGDNLVSKCPTWSWESGEPSKRKSYLPLGKQILITRNVPCLRRVASVEEEYDAAGGEVLLENEDNDGWLAIHGKPKGTKSDVEDDLPSMESLEISKSKTIPSISSYFGGGAEHHVPNVADYEELDNVIETDPATLHSTYLVAHEPNEDNILRTRTYDISITYDKYYQTPRVWLAGYDEVTIEEHPHFPGKHASIHPCRHAAVMKKIIDVLMSRGVGPEVDKYLFLFLKFMASVIPTIEYDYTMDFDLGGSNT
ncbi:E2-like enzyme [Ancistrocladus abbreviatus]